MKKITLLFTFLAISLGHAQSLPIDFADPLDANFTAAGGAVFSVTADGTNAIGQIIGGAAQYDSRMDLVLDTYIDMTTPAKTFTFEYYTTEDIVMNGLLQIGAEQDGGFAIEKGFVTDGNIGWETITIDFSDATNGYPNAADPVVFGQYAQISVFTNFADTGVSTYWIDDIAGAANGAAVPQPLTSLVVDFETATTFLGDTNLTYTDLVANDVTDGANSSATVGQLSGINTGLYSNAQLLVSENFDMSAGDKGFSIMVKGPRAIPVIKFKLEGGAANEKDAAYTTPGVWQKLTFDFTADTSVTHNKVVIFVDFATAASAVPADDVFMIDNLEFDVLSTLSAKSFSSSSVKMYPNPANDILNFSSASKKALNVAVYDLLGKQVLRANAIQSELNISSLNPGMYFVNMTQGSSTSTKKLLVK
ncbi:MAG: Uncharacterised protein [Formosa sp. Hel1_33_131]|nr:MAG: Uncharacterised protein [Formosa sp. Hel1_33_131]